MPSRANLMAVLVLFVAVLACALPGQPPAPTPAPADPTPTASWPTYTNAAHGFSISHPPELTPPPADSAEGFGAIGDQIFFNVSMADPLDCLGDCPVVETTETVPIAGLSATKVTGYVGAIGGGVPQQYQTYVFDRAGLFYSFTLYAVPTGFTSEDTNIQPLQPADIAVFEQMLATVQFTN